eukprot:scaffold808_cov370-Prasinococcus_capsulatus_cf.AAC.26
MAVRSSSSNCTSAMTTAHQAHTISRERTPAPLASIVRAQALDVGSVHCGSGRRCVAYLARKRP